MHRLLLSLMLLPALATQAAEKNKPERPKREKPAFQTLDANQDGKVGEAEFNEGMPAREGKKGDASGKTGGLFLLADKDGDGFLSMEEFAKAMDGGKQDKPRKERKKKNDP